MEHIVKTEEEAMEWFLSHSSGSIICEDIDGVRESVDCYAEAVRFYETARKED